MLGHRGVGIRAGAIDVHPLGGQLIDPHRVLIQGRCKGSPTGVVMQALKYDFEPVIGEIEASDGLSRRGTKRPKPLGHPGFDVHKAVITPRQNRTEPDRAHPTQAEALPVAVGGKVVV